MLVLIGQREVTKNKESLGKAFWLCLHLQALSDFFCINEVSLGSMKTHFKLL